MAQLLSHISERRDACDDALRVCVRGLAKAWVASSEEGFSLSRAAPLSGAAADLYARFGRPGA